MRLPQPAPLADWRRRVAAAAGVAPPRKRRVVAATEAARGTGGGAGSGSRAAPAAAASATQRLADRLHGDAVASPPPPAPTRAPFGAAELAAALGGGGSASSSSSSPAALVEAQALLLTCPPVRQLRLAELGRRAAVLRRLLPVAPARVARAAAARPALLLLPTGQPEGSAETPSAPPSELDVTLMVAQRVCASAESLCLPSARRLAAAVRVAASAVLQEESGAATTPTSAATRLAETLSAAVPDPELRFRLAVAEPRTASRSLDALLELLPWDEEEEEEEDGGATADGCGSSSSATRQAALLRRRAAAIRAALVRCPQLVGCRRARLRETVAALEEITGARGVALTALLLLAPLPPPPTAAARPAEAGTTTMMDTQEEEEDAQEDDDFAEGGEGREDDDDDEEQEADAPPSTTAAAALRRRLVRSAPRPPPYSPSDAARLLSLSPSRLRLAAEDLRLALNLGQRGLAARLRRDPTALLAPRGPGNARAVVSALARRLRCPRDEAAALALDAPPALLSRAPGAVVAVLDSVARAFGLSSGELVQAAAFDPSLLTRSPAPLQARLRRLLDAVYLPSVAERRARRKKITSSSRRSRSGMEDPHGGSRWLGTADEQDEEEEEQQDDYDASYYSPLPPPATTAWAVQLQALTRGKPQNAARLATAVCLPTGEERVDRLAFLRSGAGGKGAAGRVRLKDVLGASPRGFAAAYPSYETWRRENGQRGRRRGGGGGGGGAGSSEQPAARPAPSSPPKSRSRSRSRSRTRAPQTLSTGHEPRVLLVPTAPTGGGGGAAGAGTLPRLSPRPPLPPVPPPRPPRGSNKVDKGGM